MRAPIASIWAPACFNVTPRFSLANAPKVKAQTNQRDGQMTYHVDRATEQNKHVNYEPSSMGGLNEAPKRRTSSQRNGRIR